MTGNYLTKQIRSKYEKYWLTEIYRVKLGNDGLKHIKLRFYPILKGCFKKESYLDLVPNRSQRAELTLIRMSSSCLAVEVQRYQRRYVPERERYRTYCRPIGADNGYVDYEQHLLTACSTFTLERNNFYFRMFAININF